MRKLGEIKGEEGLDLLADLVEPLGEFSEDKIFVAYVRSRNRVKAVKQALKEHKKAVLTVMAILEGADPKTYKPPMLRLPAMLLDILNDPELLALFPSAETETSSGSAMGNIEDAEQ